MAGDWIPMRLDLFEDPAVMQMAEELGVREEVVVGYLHKVWSWMSRQCHADVTQHVTLESLGRVTHLPGFPEAMQRAGWLEETSEGIRVPNFDRWLSQSAKQRALATNRKRSQRLRDVTQMSRYDRDKTATREEKRREEVSTNVDTPIVPKKRRRKKRTVSSPDQALFEQFWKLVPSGMKTAKVRSMGHYVEAIERIGEQQADPHEFLRIRMEAYAASERAMGDYPWEPSAWLRDGHYDDDDAAWKNHHGNGQMTAREARDAKFNQMLENLK